ncbi:MAG: translation initiation inhibitor [Candidatus Hydrogenedentes bacterium]|nr:translation initiation inhibitor [Candidatus Hydrogenedentota bacterium]
MNSLDDRNLAVQIVQRNQGNLNERFIGAVSGVGETRTDFFERVSALAVPGVCISLDVFGGPPDDAAWNLLRQAFLPDPPPVTWVIEDGVPAGVVRSAQAWVAEGVDYQRVAVRGEILGTVFDDGHACYLRLAGLIPGKGGGRGVETRDGLDQMNALLADAGMSFRNVVRTWVYLADILSWYGEFNKVRTRFFHDFGVFSGLVPASTGMAGGNRAGAALSGGLFAVAPRSREVEVARVDSPLQCSARDYGSSFSRAVEITTPMSRRLLVSGTASIDRAGKTIFEGDLDAQVRQTFAVIKAILQSRGMSWGDVTRAIGYFKPGQEADIERCLRECAPPIPLIPVINHVCRDDLLFESELDALALHESV